MPPLNSIEQRITDGFAELSITVVRAEMPGPDSATMWSQSASEAPLQVTANPEGGPTEAVSVGPGRQLNGILVETVEFPNGATWQQFTCEEYVVRVAGDVPDEHSSLDEFLGAVTDALDC